MTLERFTSMASRSRNRCPSISRWVFRSHLHIISCTCPACPFRTCSSSLLWVAFTYTTPVSLFDYIYVAPYKKSDMGINRKIVYDYIYLFIDFDDALHKNKNIKIGKGYEWEMLSPCCVRLWRNHRYCLDGLKCIIRATEQCEYYAESH